MNKNYIKMGRGYDNRPNISNKQFIQETGDTFVYSGTNRFCGTINSCSGYGIIRSTFPTGTTFFNAGNDVTEIQIGHCTQTSGSAIAIGYCAHAGSQDAISIGNISCACGIGSISIGVESKTFCNCNVIIGHENMTCANNSNILGGHNNLICSGNSNVSLVGVTGHTVNPNTYSNTVVVPNLAILNIPSGTGNYLCIDGTKVCRTSGGAVSSVERITKTISQIGHTFNVKDVVGFSAGSYNKPIADGTYDGEVLGLITRTDTNGFDITQAGYVTGLTSLTANTTYFLSDTTAGLLTSIAPTADTHINKAVLIAVSETAGYVLPYPGYIITTGTTGGSGTSGITWNGSTINAIGTYGSSSTIDAEPNLTFDGSLLNVTGCLKTSDKIVAGGLSNVHATAIYQGKIDTTLNYQRYLYFKDESDSICFAIANGAIGADFFPIFGGKVTSANPALYFVGNSVTGTSVGTGLITFDGRVNDTGVSSTGTTLINFVSGYGNSKAKLMADGTFCVNSCIFSVGNIYSGAQVCAAVSCMSTCVSSPIIYSTTCTWGSVMCGTSCVRGTYVCATNAVNATNLVTTPVLRMTSGATAGYILTSDANGYGHWCAPSGGGITGGTNGLSEIGADISLGGVLTNDTCISTNTRNLIITGGTYGLGVVIKPDDVSIGNVFGNNTQGIRMSCTPYRYLVSYQCETPYLSQIFQEPTSIVINTQCPSTYGDGYFRVSSNEVCIYTCSGSTTHKYKSDFYISESKIGIIGGCETNQISTPNGGQTCLFGGTAFQCKTIDNSGLAYGGHVYIQGGLGCVSGSTVSSYGATGGNVLICAGRGCTINGTFGAGGHTCILGGCGKSSGGNVYINAGTATSGTDGKFYLTTKTQAMVAYPSSCVELYYNGSVKLCTVTNGICLGTNCGFGVDWVATSDCRLKTGIMPISNALSTITQLQGVSYCLCDDCNCENRIGLIAQDVLPILPEIVSHSQPSDDDLKYGITDDKLGLKYDKLTAILVEAIKEQQTEIKTIQPIIDEDNNRPNNSIYYSTTQGKLVYKDPDGIVHDLY